MTIWRSTTVTRHQWRHHETARKRNSHHRTDEKLRKVGHTSSAAHKFDYIFYCILERGIFWRDVMLYMYIAGALQNWRMNKSARSWLIRKIIFAPSHRTSIQTRRYIYILISCIAMKRAYKKWYIERSPPNASSFHPNFDCCDITILSHTLTSNRNTGLNTRHGRVARWWVRARWCCRSFDVIPIRASSCFLKIQRRFSLRKDCVQFLYLCAFTECFFFCFLYLRHWAFCFVNFVRVLSLSLCIKSLVCGLHIHVYDHCTCAVFWHA